MNRYQKKRIDRILECDGLTQWEVGFLTSFVNNKVVPFGEDDPDPMTDAQNHMLNELAKKYKA